MILTGRTGLLALICVLPIAVAPWPAPAFGIFLLLLASLVGALAGTASAGANQIQNNHYLTSRVDYLATDKQTFNVTFNFFNNITDDPFAFGGSTLPGFGSLNKDRTYNAVVRHTYSLTPTLVNSLLLGYARNNQPGVVPQSARISE